MLHPRRMSATAPALQTRPAVRQMSVRRSMSSHGVSLDVRLAAADSDDDFEEPPVDVKNWSAVASRIRQKLLDFPEDSD